jgi:hypothetical protein
VKLARLAMVAALAVFAGSGVALAQQPPKAKGQPQTQVTPTPSPSGTPAPAQPGAKLQVDDGKSIDLPIQTCENRGCYASFPVSPEMLAALRSGKQLKILFQDLAKETITIPMALNDFTAAYDKIK